MALPEVDHTETVIVTGASSGISAALARELAGRGRALTLVARRRDRLAELAAALRTTAQVDTVVADLSLPDDRDRFLSSVAEQGLAVGGLVNCAGLGTVGRVDHVDGRRELHSVRVNVEALIDLPTRAVPLMAPPGRGIVLHVAGTVRDRRARHRPTHGHPRPGKPGDGTAAPTFSYSPLSARRSQR